MRKIVVLDGQALNPGDLSWGELEALGSCRIYPRTAPSALIFRAQDADILLTNKTPVTAEAVRELPALRYIGVLATGVDAVDLAAARLRGIPVTNVPGYGTHSVAQHTWALILELAAGTSEQAQSVRNGRWTQGADWCYWTRPVTELSGSTLGIVGSGRIGREVGRIGSAFGMHVLYATRERGHCEIERVFASSDIVSLHCPLNAETHELVNRRTLMLMKPSAFLVNTSRGGLIREQDLAEHLNAGHLAGAALDVLSTEPPTDDNPLLRARNCIITPHLAWASVAARRRLMRIAVDNINAFLKGSPMNVVN
jgi:glycerate dehydrogenase